MLSFEMLHPEMTMEHLGFIPSFLDPEDPDSAKEQIDKNYQHGGGWRSFKGHKLHDDNSIEYPGDPPLQPLAQARLRDELIVFYDYSWVAIIQPDRSYEICRVD